MFDLDNLYSLADRFLIPSGGSSHIRIEGTPPGVSLTYDWTVSGLPDASEDVLSSHTDYAVTVFNGIRSEDIPISLTCAVTSDDQNVRYFNISVVLLSTSYKMKIGEYTQPTFPKVGFLS